MILRQFYLNCLAHASYLIGDERSGLAAVVDPQRDVDQYLAFVQHWQWGNSILEWIRQCETTFDARLELRNLLRADVWPHAGRSSFVVLLEDKLVKTGGVEIEIAPEFRPPVAAKPAADLRRPQFAREQDAVVAREEIHPVGTARGIFPGTDLGVVGEEISLPVDVDAAARRGDVDAV